MLLDDIPAEDVGRAPVLLPLLGLVNEPCVRGLKLEVAVEV